jgi:hypothetical protein
MKKLIVAILMVLFLAPVVYAGSIGNFVKNEDPSNPLALNLYVAKTWEDKDVPLIGETDVRVKFERTSPIDTVRIDEADYTISVGIEL